jgi:hypothetical protein
VCWSERRPRPRRPPSRSKRRSSRSGRSSSDGTVTRAVTVEEALPGSIGGKVTPYPSSLSNLLDGVEDMVRVPGGCFEQTIGEPVRLRAEVANATARGVPSPIARIGLPAGTRVDTWQLEQLQDRGEIAFFETRPREVTLYWEGFDPLAAESPCCASRVAANPFGGTSSSGDFDGVGCGPPADAPPPRGGVRDCPDCPLPPITFAVVETDDYWGPTGVILDGVEVWS